MHIIWLVTSKNTGDRRYVCMVLMEPLPYSQNCVNSEPMHQVLTHEISLGESEK